MWRSGVQDIAVSVAVIAYLGEHFISYLLESVDRSFRLLFCTKRRAVGDTGQSCSEITLLSVFLLSCRPLQGRPGRCSLVFGATGLDKSDGWLHPCIAFFVGIRVSRVAAIGYFRLERSRAAAAAAAAATAVFYCYCITTGIPQAGSSKHPRLCRPRMPHAIATLMSHF